jgi:hypothetical protein
MRTLPKPVDQRFIPIADNTTDTMLDIPPRQFLSNRQTILDQSPHMNLSFSRNFRSPECKPTSVLIHGER